MAETDKKEKVIGIDLGTTNSCAAIVRGGRPEVIPNAEGDRVTPSAVAFTESGEIRVGKLAKREAVPNPERTVLSIKRKMGTDYRVKISLDGEVKEYPPEQISAFILQKIRHDAEEYLGTEIKRAVITVPAYFDDNQRKATKDAGEITGLEVPRIINEPTAAALAYGLGREGEETVLVYDLGGGTFDVSILEIAVVEVEEEGEKKEDVVSEVRATAGDTQLGGDDFDRRIMDIDLRNDSAAMQRLRDAAEQAKIELSSLMETKISLPYITADASGPKHLENTLTRAQFEEMIEDLLERTMRIVDSALQAAKLNPEYIDQVVLVGGSTRIPKVQELVVKKFGKAKINKGINPDEVVAMGAAIYAAGLGLLVDVTPLTLSVETAGGIVSPIIESNTLIPVERTKTFTTAEDYQTQVEIHVVQGERKMAADNVSLGRFILSDIPPAPRGVPQIDVTFSIDADGILHVRAKDQATEKEASITIKGTSRLSEDEIKRMRKEAEEHAEEDKKKMELARARNEAEQFAHSVEKSLRDLGDKVPAARRAGIEAVLKSLRDTLEKEEADITSIRQATEELKRVAGEVVAGAYGGAETAEADSHGEAPADD